MGGSSSKTSKTSIDVSGNNNYVVQVNGKEFNFTSACRDVVKYINAENSSTMRDTYLNCVIVMTLLITLVISLSLYLYAQYHKQQYRIIMESIKDDIQEVNRNIRKITYKTNHSSTLSFRQQTDRQSSNIDEDHFQSIDKRIPSDLV